jgi:phenolic acid decarboxylase
MAKTMNKVITITAAMLIATITSNAQVSKVWATIAPNAIPTEVNGQIVSSDADFNQVISNLSITEIERALPSSRSLNLLNVYEITCSCEEGDLIAELTMNVSSVTGVVEAPKYESLQTPNDINATFAQDYAIELINAQGAWNITQGNSSLTIGISDENFYHMHEELAGKVTYYDTTNTLSQNHGTAVAILAAGNTNNGVGKASIGYNSNLALYRMNYNEVLAASYAGIKLINLSWASGCSFNPYAQDAINEVYNNGTFIVAAAGNGSTCGGPDNLVYPAAFDNVFSVTSVGPSDNHERTIGNDQTTHQHNSTVDLSAPGYDVAISSAPGWYLTGNGTSFAAPQVTGTIALMMSVNPCLTFENIEHILKTTSVNIDSVNIQYAGKIGVGRLDAGAAVAMAQNWSSVSFTAEIIPASCAGMNDGKIDLTILSGNVSGFWWDANGETTEDIANLSAGTYRVIITTVGGCETWGSFVVTEPEVLEANIETISTENNTNLNLTVTGGTAPYTYSWNTNDTQEDLFNVFAGFYQVEVTDAKGCSVIANTEVEEMSHAGIDFNDKNEFTVYPNPSNGNATVSWEGEAQYLYILNQSGQIVEKHSVAQTTTYDVSNLPSGMYQVVLMQDNVTSNLKLVVQ